jgi:hypothetical protein
MRTQAHDRAAGFEGEFRDEGGRSGLRRRLLQVDATKAGPPHDATACRFTFVTVDYFRTLRFPTAISMKARSLGWDCIRAGK